MMVTVMTTAIAEMMNLRDYRGENDSINKMANKFNNIGLL